MTKELVAALFTEFNDTTAENVEHGKVAMRLIFNSANRDMRLIGTFSPLLGGSNNLPHDAFEAKALRLALQGLEYKNVEHVSGHWYYRASVPLRNTMHPACALCHTQFTPESCGVDDTEQWVGALVQTGANLIPVGRP